MQNLPADRTCQSCGSPVTVDSLFCPVCQQHYSSPAGTVAASYGIRFGAWALDFILIPFTLVIGWLIWAMFTFRNGQTPGKALLDIRVVRDTGEPSMWGLTFVREILIKRIAVPFISALTLGIFNFLNYLWPLWDRNLQALHDKMVSTVVVRQGVAIERVQEARPSMGGEPAAVP